eukprot:scaffold14497_cov57-Attheya_sp.AAC.1
MSVEHYLAIIYKHFATKIQWLARAWFQLGTRHCVSQTGSEYLPQCPMKTVLATIAGCNWVTASLHGPKTPDPYSLTTFSFLFLSLRIDGSISTRDFP